MSTPTKAPGTSKSRTRKAPAPDTCRLTVTIRGESYTVRPVRAESSEVCRIWRLRKPDGTAYNVVETIHGAGCDCGDQTFRHEGRDQTGCKHIRALRALSLIEPDSEDGPESWPAWTDTHAFVTSR